MFNSYVEKFDFHRFLYEKICLSKNYFPFTSPPILLFCNFPHCVCIYNAKNM